MWTKFTADVLRKQDNTSKKFLNLLNVPHYNANFQDIDIFQLKHNLCLCLK